MAIEPQRHRFTVANFHQMTEAGLFEEDDRLELIEGDILDMTPVGRHHASFVARLTRLFGPLNGSRATIWPQNPIDLGEQSEPEPDFVLLRPDPHDYMAGHPVASDVLLLIEIADTSLEYDRRTKARLYAQHNVPEYWLVDVSSTPATITVYRDPTASGYRSARVVRRGERLAAEAFPDLVLNTDELLG